jgi:hypothetical protein
LRHIRNLVLTQDALGRANSATTRICAKTTKEEHVRAQDCLFEGDSEE